MHDIANSKCYDAIQISVFDLHAPAPAPTPTPVRCESPLLVPSGCDILTQGLIGLIEYSYHQGISFFRSPPAKNPRVKRAWPRVISGWVTDRKVFPGVHK
jgi:hypothetical protein